MLLFYTFLFICIVGVALTIAGSFCLWDDYNQYTHNDTLKAWGTLLGVIGFIGMWCVGMIMLTKVYDPKQFDKDYITAQTVIEVFEDRDINTVNELKTFEWAVTEAENINHKIQKTQNRRDSKWIGRAFAPEIGDYEPLSVNIKKN